VFLAESGQSDLTTQCMAEEEKGDSEERVDLRLLCLLLVLLRSIPPLHDAAKGVVAVFHPNTEVFQSFRGTDRDDNTRIFCFRISTGLNASSERSCLHFTNRRFVNNTMASLVAMPIALSINMYITLLRQLEHKGIN
jgi:hypothetical protein